VTHELDIASFAKRKVVMRDGLIRTDETVPTRLHAPEALAKLEKGKTTTEPVQTQYGYHVIQLEDVRSPSAPAFEEVKEQVKMFAQRKKLQAYLDDLRKTAKIQKTG